MAEMPAPSRISDIEVLRAVAILFVLVEHSLWNLVFNVPDLAWLLGRVPLWCGVDLFFVISGFVITRGLLTAASGAEPAGAWLRRFWIRRAFRLWPAAWLWLGLMLAGSFLFRHPPFMGTPALNARGALAGMLGFANIRFGLHVPFTQYGPTFPYWSLSVEEQFYLLLPPVIWLARRRLAWVAALLLLVQFPLPHPRLYFFWRSDGLLWGVLLAACPALRGVAEKVASRLSLVPCAGPVVLLACLATMTQLSPRFEQSPPFWLGALAAVAAVPVWLASANQNLFRLGRLQGIGLWLGSRSYALYLCHMPIFQLAAFFSRSLGASAHLELRSVVFGVPLLAAASEFTYRFVEAPLREFGKHLARTDSCPA